MKLLCLFYQIDRDLLLEAIKIFSVFKQKLRSVIMPKLSLKSEHYAQSLPNVQTLNIATDLQP